MCSYTSEPENEKEFTEDFNQFYSKYAFFYNVFTKMFPTWKSWLKKAIPLIVGPRVLEISFGPGYLLTKYADKFDTYGIDYCQKMVEITKKNLKKKGLMQTFNKGM